MRYTFTHEGTIKGYYELNPFPGCNQIIVSNHTTIYPQHRGQGLGKLMAQERIERARDLGYDLMICTVKANNEAQLKILDKMGWTQMEVFNNKESGNEVHIYTLHL